MSNQRIKERYRNYDLLSTFYKGKFRGRVWKNRELIHDTEGVGVEAVLSTLRDMVDDIIEEKISKRGGASPAVQEYIDAFNAIMDDIHDGQFAMLKSHYNAPNRSITATQLSKAANYDHWGSANLHYGVLGQKLCDELNLKLDPATRAIATEKENGTDKGEWLWIMRPEVAEAVEYFGLNE